MYVMLSLNAIHAFAVHGLDLMMALGVWGCLGTGAIDMENWDVDGGAQKQFWLNRRVRLKRRWDLDICMICGRLGGSVGYD